MGLRYTGNENSCGNKDNEEIGVEWGRGLLWSLRQNLNALPHEGRLSAQNSGQVGSKSWWGVGGGEKLIWDFNLIQILQIGAR